jgi:hypothetical protein
MLKKNPTRSTNFFIDMKTNLPVYIGIIIVLLIVRLPSFFFSVFDWDESTMILMGQSIIDGYMPYIDAWDMKPPLAFYVYALFIILFGKSIIAIRLGGLLCIYCASLFIYKAGNVIHSKTAGILSALFLIVFVSIGPSGLSTMTEHILIMPIAFIVYVLVAKDINKKVAFIIGTILGMAILVRTNIFFESFAICILLLSGFLNPSMTVPDRIKRCIVLIIGISIPIFLIGYYYVIHNALDIFLKTNIATISAYVGLKEASLVNKIDIFFFNIEQNIKMNLFLWITFVLGILYIIFLKRWKDKFLLILMTIFTFQIFSLFITGQRFGHHYFVTSMPLMCLMSGLALSQWLTDNKTRKILYSVTVMLIIAGLLFALQENVMKYDREIVSRIVEKQPLLDDSCYKIARLLNNEDVRGQYIYIVNSCHIVNWLTESRYPTKYVHPSNLLEREYMIKIVDGPSATKEKELLKILSKNPTFIIYKQASWPEQLDRYKEILDNEIKANYELVQTIDTFYHVYKRKS